MQCSSNVEDVGPALYKWYTNGLYLLGKIQHFLDIEELTGWKTGQF